MINIIGKDFLQLLLLKATFKDASFETEQKSLWYTLVCASFLCISQEEKFKKILFIGSKFSFPYVRI